MSDLPLTQPYGSAMDLPSVQEMEQQLVGFRLLGILLPRDQRRELKRIRREHREITQTVDDFYALLGPRNWVFHNDMHLTDIRGVIDTDDPETAERRLIDYYQADGRLASSIRRLKRFDAMRPRHRLLQYAHDDYEAERYYSTVLALIAVMDGFVNDSETSVRRGLHARPVEEMVAWDSVVGHHLGLSHAHETFRRSFYKTSEEEVTEVYRNGIMHGVLVNFDNEVVATKAWNRLLAVADWADARIKQAMPAEPEPSIRESISRWQAIQEEKEQIESWRPHEHEIDLADSDQHDVVVACADFLERWQRKQYGPLGQFFFDMGADRATFGQQALLAKDLYSLYELRSWSIHRRRHTAASVAHVDTTLMVGDSEHEVELRWVHVDNQGTPALENTGGVWRLAPYGPTSFLA